MGRQRLDIRVGKNQMSDKIFVKSGKYVLPFSTWSLAQSIMPTGIDPEKAHRIAREVRDHIAMQGSRFISKKTIKKLVISHLNEISSDLAERYEVWRMYREARTKKKIKEPLIILIGGATGSGKSTIALEVAHRLGIRNVIGTDYIRQILRTSFSPEILPDIHLGTYNAWKAVKVPLAPGEDKILIGYVEQAKHVLVGIEAVIRRAMKEGTDVIIEGIHILPSIMDKDILNKANISIAILTIDNEEMHKLRFFKRAEYSARPVDQYLKDFKSIRKIQAYIVEQCSSLNIPVIKNVFFDKSVEAIIEKLTHKTRMIIS
jgi:2-phosphoglycerate kinase